MSGHSRFFKEILAFVFCTTFIYFLFSLLSSAFALSTRKLNSLFGFSDYTLYLCWVFDGFGSAFFTGFLSALFYFIFFLILSLLTFICFASLERLWLFLKSVESLNFMHMPVYCIGELMLCLRSCEWVASKSSSLPLQPPPMYWNSFIHFNLFLFLSLGPLFLAVVTAAIYTVAFLFIYFLPIDMYVLL